VEGGTKVYPDEREIETGVFKGHLRDVVELANKFNEFFTSVGARAAAESKRLALVNALPAYKGPSAKTIFQLEEF